MVGAAAGAAPSQRLYRLRFTHPYELVQLMPRDRQTRITYPDGRALDFGYTPRGLLESVPGIIEGATYEARGPFTRREHSNGGVSTASYDDLHRLATLETSARV